MAGRDGQPVSEATADLAAGDLPEYLRRHYWWAYLHPWGVRLFERRWLVNLILWGHFGRLRDAVLDELGPNFAGRLLQVACVYGDLTEGLRRCLAVDGRLDVVDVAPIQLDNLARKSKGDPRLRLHRQDAADLRFADGGHDAAVVFFLLHEQPPEVRRRTIGEVLRVIRPGGRILFVDYHRPARWNPARYLMAPVLWCLEPYALDLWHGEITDWARPGSCSVIEQRTYCGGLYQMLIVRRAG